MLAILAVHRQPNRLGLIADAKQSSVAETNWAQDPSVLYDQFITFRFRLQCTFPAFCWICELFNYIPRYEVINLNIKRCFSFG